MGNGNAKEAYAEARAQYLESLKRAQQMKKERVQMEEQIRESKRQEEYAREAKAYFASRANTWQNSKGVFINVRSQIVKELQSEIDGITGPEVQISENELRQNGRSFSDQPLLPEDLEKMAKRAGEDPKFQEELEQQFADLFKTEQQKRKMRGEPVLTFDPSEKAGTLARGIVRLSELKKLHLEQNGDFTFTALGKLDQQQREGIEAVLDRLLRAYEGEDKKAGSLAEYSAKRHAELDKKSFMRTGQEKAEWETLEAKKRFIKDVVVKQAMEEEAKIEKDIKAAGILALVKQENENRKKLQKETAKRKQDVIESIPGQQRDQMVNKRLGEAAIWKKELDEARQEFRSASMKRRIYETGLDLTERMAYTLKQGIVVITDASVTAPLTAKKQALEEAKAKQERTKRGIAYGAGTLVGPDPQAEEEKPEKKKKTSTISFHELAQKHETTAEAIGKMEQEVRQLEKAVKQQIEENHRRLNYLAPAEDRETMDRRQEAEAVISKIQEKVSKESTPAKRVSQEEQVQRRTELDIQEREALKALENDETYQSMTSHINQISSLFTDHSLRNIERVVKVCKGICRLADKIMGNGESPQNVGDAQGLEDHLNTVKEALKSEEPENYDGLRNSILEIGVILEENLSSLSQKLKARTLEAQGNYDALENALWELEGREERFSRWKEGKTGNDAKLMIQFTEEETQARTKGMDQVIDTQQKGKEEAERIEEEERAKAETLTQEMERFYEADQEISEREGQLHRAFAQTVLENGEKTNGPITLSKEDLFDQKGPEDFTFLSKLTGVPMSADMDLDMAVEAFRRIHINGVNAVMYFNLEERYQEAMTDDVEKGRLIRGLADYGFKIKEALQASMEAPSQKLTGYAAGLAGQSIAVEQDSLLLTPVKLENPVLSKEDRERLPEKERADHDRICSFNRYTSMITSDMNEMRKGAAEAELKGQGEQTKREKAFTQAVHRSRSIAPKSMTEPKMQR